MEIKKNLLLLSLLLGLSRFCAAQDFPSGGVSNDEMGMKSYAADPSAHAVVLNEFGKARIDVTNDDKIKVLLEYHVKIKIFDAKGFDQGTVKIPVYSSSGDGLYETVDDITGATYYTDDNGLTQKIELENKKIYPVKQSKYLATYNFALPGLRNGCVIEYKYTLESPFWWDFPSWSFQSDIPKVYSEYEAHIPGFWVFNASLKGFLKISKSSATVESKCFSSGGSSCDCSLLVYGMSNIPAFVEEDYMTAKKNYLSAINFELSEYTNPYTGVKVKWTKEWSDIDKLLKDDLEFGGQLKKRDCLKTG
jgi:hypothetical protein